MSLLAIPCQLQSTNFSFSKKTNFISYSNKFGKRNVCTQATPSTICIKHHLPYGQHLRLTGGAKSLGDWDPHKALVLKWTEGDVWKGQCDLEAGPSVECKLVVGSEASEATSKGVKDAKKGSTALSFEWQSGSNRQISIPKGIQSAEVTLQWSDPSVSIKPVAKSPTKPSTPTATPTPPKPTPKPAPAPAHAPAPAPSAVLSPSAPTPSTIASSSPPSPPPAKSSTTPSPKPSPISTPPPSSPSPIHYSSPSSKAPSPPPSAKASAVPAQVSVEKAFAPPQRTPPIEAPLKSKSPPSSPSPSSSPSSSSAGSSTQPKARAESKADGPSMSSSSDTPSNVTAAASLAATKKKQKTSFVDAATSSSPLAAASTTPAVEPTGAPRKGDETATVWRRVSDKISPTTPLATVTSAADSETLVPSPRPDKTSSVFLPRLNDTDVATPPARAGSGSGSGSGSIAGMSDERITRLLAPAAFSLSSLSSDASLSSGVSGVSQMDAFTFHRQDTAPSVARLTTVTTTAAAAAAFSITTATPFPPGADGGAAPDAGVPLPATPLSPTAAVAASGGLLTDPTPRSLAPPILSVFTSSSSSVADVTAQEGDGQATSPLGSSRDWSYATTSQIRNELRRRGLESSGDRRELINRIESVL